MRSIVADGSPAWIRSDQHIDRETLRQQHCLGHAIGTAGEQFEGSAPADVTERLWQRSNMVDLLDAFEAEQKCVA
jgi:hypothetical protein